MSDQYGSSSIKILSFIEHVRHRPGMWIGSTDVDGIHHLLREVVDNSVDEMIAGHCDKIHIHLNTSDNEITVIDNGRGIPFGTHKDTGTETLVEIFSTSFSGGKFDSESYDVSSGMNGVGLGVVNALSSSLKCWSVRNNQNATVTFKCGTDPKFVGPSSNKSSSGTTISFTPDSTIFPDVVFDQERITTLIWELSNLLPNREFKFTTGTQCVTYYSNKNTSYDNEVIYNQSDYLIGIYNAQKSPENEIFNFQYLKDDLSVIIYYNKDTQYSLKSFMNMINTEDHGSHVDGVVKALINGFKKITGKSLTKSQIMIGLNIIVSMKYQSPVFRGQSKSKVSDSRVEQRVYTDIYTDVYNTLLTNKTFVKYLVTVIEAQTKVIDEIEIKTTIANIKDKVKNNRLPIKLMAVHGCSVDDRELIICEGDSAAGGVTIARNPSFQEVLPIRGKILNAFKSDKASVLKSKEVNDIFISIGGMEDTNTPLRCKKVFILTDSDDDGKHITSLLITLFSSLFPSFIKKYELYVMNTPLFTAVSGDNRAYGHDVRSAKANFNKRFGRNRVPEIYRNKGLGEMDPIELTTVLDPSTRDVVKLEIGENSLPYMERLMGNSVDLRHDILKEVNNASKTTK